MSADDEMTRTKGRQALGAGPADFLMSYIGYLYPGKGIETLLRALKLLATERPQVRLAIIGGSIARVFEDQQNYPATLRALASDLGIADKVVWTGDYRWDSDEASTFLRASDACVLPFDGGVHLNNSSFASATAHDLPVITTRGTLLEPQFVHGENVFLCQPKSPTEIAAAITTLVDDPTLRRTLSHGSQQLARQWYSWGPAVDRTLALLGGSRQPAGNQLDRQPSSDTRSAPSTVSG
jgi:glycosyltransferase involved in cell wall biosynthesis